MKKIIVIYGGRSAESDISVLSAFSMLQAVDYTKFEIQPVFINKEGNWLKGNLYQNAPEKQEELVLVAGENAEQITPSAIYEKDVVVFPILHGPMGEDGTVQGFLETIGMPYVGAGVLASAAGMDKITTKYLLQVAGIPQVAYVAVTRSEYTHSKVEVFEKCEGSLLYPMFVKPANMGSSVGISKAVDKESLEEALDLALKYDSRILVEQGIDAREIEVAVLGNEDVQTTLPGEVVKDVAFYDYNAKYIDNKIEMQIPAHIDEEIMQQMRDYAQLAYKTLDGSGLSRCDFFLSKNNEIFLNELNTMPGFTPYSMYPLLWENMGLKYSDLVEKLIQLAEERFKLRQSYYNN